jgi:YbbR domain-containing protein
MLRWVWENLRTLALALVLGLAVWVTAVNAADPLEARAYPAAIAIEYTGVDPALLIVGNPPQEGHLTVQAPSSVWDQITQQDLHLRASLAKLGPGTHQVRVDASIDRRPARVTASDPLTVAVTLERSASKTVSVRAAMGGDALLGYRAEQPQVTPASVTVTGPASQVAQVREAVAEIDITGRRDNVDEQVILLAADASGEAVTGVELSPNLARVVVPIQQIVGYRLVAVLPIIQGQVEAGYQVTNITITPTLVTVFSPDPQAVDALPGYVETEAVSLAGATQSIERRVSLSLTKGIFLAGSQDILVQITIAPIEITTTITRTLEFQGLKTGLHAQASPSTVSVILKGPLPTLEKLAPEDVRVILDLAGLGIGTYQLTPQVTNLPADVVRQTILPDTIEVVIAAGPPPSPTPAP